MPDRGTHRGRRSCYTSQVTIVSGLSAVPWLDPKTAVPTTGLQLMHHGRIKPATVWCGMV